MNSLQIEAFLAIVKTKNISRAAEVLYLSQPTVSYRLKSLEDELGFALLERSKGYRTIELTAKGKSFVSLANRWMQLWQDVQMLSAANEKLPLILSCNNSTNANLLAPLYKKLVQSGEDALFELTIQANDTAGIYRAIDAREADIGLVFENIPSKSILIEPLFREHMYLARLCSDPGEIRTAYHPAELNVEDELFLDSSSVYRKWHDQWWNPMARPYVNISTESLLLDFMDSPRFWAVVPASVVDTLKKNSSIKIYELLHPPGDRVCYRITSRTPPESRKRNIQIFNEYLKAYIRTLDFASVVS